MKVYQTNELAGTRKIVKNLPECLTAKEWVAKLNVDAAKHINYQTTMVK